MTTELAARASTLLLGLFLFSASGLSAPSEDRVGTSPASISGAIAARIIAVKCNRPMQESALTRTEIVELDTFIDERQTAFMMESEANQRLSEIIFPTLARDYNKIYSDPDACNAASRELAKSTLQRVRDAQAALKQRAELEK